MTTNSEAILDLRTLAAVSLFCSADPSRYYIGGVHIEVDADGVTYVATDGHRLAARRVELPAAAERNTLTGNWIIAAEDCRKFKVGKRDTGLARLSMSAGNLLIQGAGRPMIVQPVDGSFPDWRRIVPQKTDGRLPTSLTVNGVYHADIYKFAKLLDLGPPHAHWNSDGGAVPFTWKEHPETFCLVMPLRQGAAPAWSVPSFARAA